MLQPWICVRRDVPSPAPGRTERARARITNRVARCVGAHEAQKSNFNPNWISRGSLAPVICPKFPAPMVVLRSPVPPKDG